MGKFQNAISVDELRRRNEVSQQATVQKPPQEQPKTPAKKG